MRAPEVAKRLLECEMPVGFGAERERGPINPCPKAAFALAIRGEHPRPCSTGQSAGTQSVACFDGQRILLGRNCPAVGCQLTEGASRFCRTKAASGNRDSPQRNRPITTVVHGMALLRSARMIRSQAFPSPYGLWA